MRSALNQRKTDFVFVIVNLQVMQNEKSTPTKLKPFHRIIVETHQSTYLQGTEWKKISRKKTHTFQQKRKNFPPYVEIGILSFQSTNV